MTDPGSIESSRLRPRLQLVRSADPALEQGRPTPELITRRDLTPVCQRPGERVERWSLKGSRAFDDVVVAARHRGLPFDVAVALVLERSYVINDLSILGAEIVAALDRVAADRSLGPASNAVQTTYARALEGSGGVELDDATTSTHSAVGLPVRLADRIAASWPPEDTFGAEDLELAVAWELHAYTSGFTLSEWAYRTALQLSLGGCPPRQSLARDARTCQTK